MLKNIIIASIRFYRYFISPLFPSCCRFHPTCSDYAVQSVQKHGVVKGFYFTVLRLLKCHPFHPGGIDPVK